MMQASVVIDHQVELIVYAFTLEEVGGMAKAGFAGTRSLHQQPEKCRILFIVAETADEIRESLEAIANDPEAFLAAYDSKEDLAQNQDVLKIIKSARLN